MLKKQLFFVVAALLTTTLSAQFSILKDIGSGSDNGLPYDASHVLHKGKVYFAGYDDVYATLFETDGTTAGTKAVTSSATISSVDYLCSTGSKLFFAGYGTAPTLYLKDNSAGGASKLAQFNGGLAPFDLFALDANRIIFGLTDFNATASQLWVSDGTVVGTKKLGDFALANGFMHAFKLADKLLIVEQSTNSTQSPSILTDGTAAGTQKLTDFLKPILPNLVSLDAAVSMDDFLFLNTQVQTSPGFQANKDYAYNQATGEKTEFSISGSLRRVLKMGSNYLLVATYEIGIWNPMTKTFTSLNSSPSYWTEPILYKNKVFFHSDDQKIWSTDGTAAGTQKLTDQTVGSFNFSPLLFAKGDSLYFSYRDFSENSLYSLNLTTNVATKFVDIGSTQVEIPFLETVNTALVFARFEAINGYELWRFGSATIGTTTPEIGSLSLAPNPTTDFFELKNEEPFSSDAILEIVSLSDGRVLKTEKIGGLTHVRCSTEALAAGVFSVVLIENGHVFQQKLVKR